MNLYLGILSLRISFKEEGAYIMLELDKLSDEELIKGYGGIINEF